MLKEILPDPPAMIRNDAASIQQLFQTNVAPTYARFELAFKEGRGSYLWDVTGKRYLDFGGGIAVTVLGHSHPAMVEALTEQAKKLIHVSNLYFTEPQGGMAQAIVSRIGKGKVFFCNSGAEANEGLIKLARRFGNDEGRFEIITATNCFHGRTLAGIAASGQEKVKKGFGPAVPGFQHVPYNDLAAMEEALTPATAAILIEGIQGEIGVIPATVDYLLGLRKLCDERRLLLMIDEVQSGHYRTGAFHSYQRLLENETGVSFLPDAVSMAKSLGGGFPMGAFWIRQPFADLLGAGSHGTTFGGTPLACAVGLKILEVIEQQKLAENARRMGDRLVDGLKKIAAEFPGVIAAVRGVGLMIGFELYGSIPKFASDGAAPSLQCIRLLHQAGLLAVPSGQKIVRLLPALNLSAGEVDEGLGIIRKVVGQIA